MRTKRKLLAALVVTCCALAAPPTQHAAAPVYYHWVSREVVYLWRTETDLKPVRAVRGKSAWTLDPAAAAKDAAWLEVLRADTPNLPAGADPWQPFLKRLSEEQPNNERAKVRKLDLQIYLRTLSPGHVFLTFVKDGNAAMVEFEKSDGRWGVNSAERLSQLTNAYPAEARAVLNAKDLPLPGELADAWGGWIDKFVAPQAPSAKLTPAEADGRPLAIWQERLTEGEWFRRVTLLPTATPQPAASPVPPGVPPVIETKIPFYRELWFQLLTGAFLVALVTVAWHRKWFSSAGGPKEMKGVARRKSVARKQVEQRGGKVFDLAEGDEGGALDGIYDEFLKNTAEGLQRLRAEVEGVQARFVQEVGMDGLPAEEARELLKLGEAARACRGTLMREPSPNGGPGAKLFPDSKRSGQQWLTGLPESVISVMNELRLKTAEAEQLGKDVKSHIAQNAEHAAALQKKVDELKASVRERAELEGEKLRLQKELEAAQKSGDDSQAVINAVVQASAIANNFQHGLGYYLSQNDPAATAIVSALVNYSLSRLCQGYAEQKQELVDAMLANLYTIAERLKDVHGFDLATREMLKNYTGIDSLRDKLDTTSKDHRDARMFQVLLKHLRETGRHDLAPFYFAVDQDGKVHYAG